MCVKERESACVCVGGGHVGCPCKCVCVCVLHGFYLLRVLLSICVAIVRGYECVFMRCHSVFVCLHEGVQLCVLGPTWQCCADSGV